jgi:hypothetical protein
MIKTPNNQRHSPEGGFPAETDTVHPNFKRLPDKNNHVSGIKVLIHFYNILYVYAHEYNI